MIGCCLKRSDEGLFRAFEDAVWEEISRHFEGIIGCCSHKDQSAFSEREELLFEMIRRESLESVRGAVLKGSVQGDLRAKRRLFELTDGTTWTAAHPSMHL